MHITAIIAEYNPFHNGHRRQIEAVRRLGATHIIAIMSGSVVQRGDVAVYDAHDRAQSAIDGGADLVLELLPQHSLSAARDFAAAGTDIVKRLGCVDSLCFGAETPDISLLERALVALGGGEAEIKRLMSSGKTYPQAAALACGEEVSKIISGQNNILALEYLRALKGSGITPIAIERNVPHDGESVSGRYASASKIRKMLYSGENTEELTGYPPFENVAFLENGDRAILGALLKMTEKDFCEIRGVKELSRRLYQASRRAESTEELLFAVKSRNFTLSRIRRAVLCCALGIKNEDAAPQEFARILAIGPGGTQILRTLRNVSQIQLDTSLAELSKLSCTAARQAELTERASRLRCLCTEKVSGISEYSKSVRVKK